MNMKIKKILCWILAFFLAINNLSLFLPIYVKAESGNDNLENSVKNIIQNPREADSGAVTWDLVEFGSYYIDNDSIKQPIQWRVLYIDGDDVLLLADQGIDSKPYNDEQIEVTWETCSLRNWLNNKEDPNSFINIAFTEKEQASIKKTNIYNGKTVKAPEVVNADNGNDTEDNIFLLSFDEMYIREYGFNTSGEYWESSHNFIEHQSYKVNGAKATRYAVLQGAVPYDSKYFTQYNGYNGWWLRSSGYRNDHASYVDYDGYVRNGDPVDFIGHSVRPAMHIDLTSADLRYVGTVCTNEKELDSSICKNITVPYESGDEFEGDIYVGYDDNDFLTDSSLYNHHLCRFAASLSTLAYNKRTDKNEEALVALGFDADNINHVKDITASPIAAGGEGKYSPYDIMYKTINLNNRKTNVVLVSIRGTYNEEWINNFEPGYGAETHEGFQSACDYVYEGLEKCINGLEGDIKILVTGHSVKPQIISGDLSRLFKAEIPVIFCGQ